MIELCLAFLSRSAPTNSFPLKLPQENHAPPRPERSDTTEEEPVR